MTSLVTLVEVTVAWPFSGIEAASRYAEGLMGVDGSDSYLPEFSEEPQESND
jgi:hypothetical protein